MKIQFLLVLTGMFSLGLGHAFADSESTEPAITVQMNGPSTFYSSESNQIIRATVEIQNYTPSDGIYFMKVTHLPTQKVMRDFEIYPKPSGNDLWSVQIAYPFLESDIKIGDQTLFGEFEIHIRTEFGSQTNSTVFSIFEYRYGPESKTEPEPNGDSQKIPDWVRNNAEWWVQGSIGDSDFVSGIQYLIKEGIMTIPETAQGTTSDDLQEIPSWIKHNADWWAQGLITDDDFVKGIQYLVEQGIINV